MIDHFDCAALEAPLVSVILPVYNGALFLDESIKSILSQSSENLELLIIYDISSDKSLEIIERYRSIDKRVKLVLGDNAALIGALNKGIELAKGKFIARMDADDVSMHNRFKEQIELLESKQADICGSHFLVINESGSAIDAKIVPLHKDEFVACLAAGVPFPHGSVMIRLDFLKKHRLSYGLVECSEDYKLWVMLFEAGAVFANVDKFIFKCRKTSSSLSQRLKKCTARDAKSISNGFVLNNYNEYANSVNCLLNNYENISFELRKFLLIGALRASISKQTLIFFRVLFNSSGTAVLLFLCALLR